MLFDMTQMAMENQLHTAMTASKPCRGVSYRGPGEGLRLL